ncbi:hypothetical protein ACX83E_29075, partial [Burkholderia pseudomallei]
DSGPRLHPGARPARKGVLAVATARCRSHGGRQASTDARRGGAGRNVQPNRALHSRVYPRARFSSARSKRRFACPIRMPDSRGSATSASIARRETKRETARQSPLFRPRRVPRAADAIVANHPQAGRPIINECATAGYDRRQRILSGGFPTEDR